MLHVTQSGNFKKTEELLKKASIDPMTLLNYYGQKGVNALEAATPKDTGTTASSWQYEIRRATRGWRIDWINTNVVDGVNVAIILEYGHGTRSGGYVRGRKYINPALQSIFDAFANDIWKELVE